MRSCPQHQVETGKICTMPSRCANNSCNSILNILYDTKRGSQGSMFTRAYFFLTGCAWRPPVVYIRENITRYGSLGWGENSVSIESYWSWSAHRSSEGGRGALFKMGHRLSALQQKLNLTNCLTCIEPWRNGVDLQVEQPRYRNICEQYRTDTLRNTSSIV